MNNLTHAQCVEKFFNFIAFVLQKLGKYQFLAGENVDNMYLIFVEN